MDRYSDRALAAISIIFMVVGVTVGLYFGAILGKLGEHARWRVEAVQKGHAKWTIDAEGNGGWEWLTPAATPTNPTKGSK